MTHDNLTLLISLVLAGAASILYLLRRNSYRPWAGIIFVLVLVAAYNLIEFIQWAWTE